LSNENRTKALLKEYEIAAQFNVHQDQLNWQVGSILVGGSIAAVALSFSVSNSQLKLAPALVSAAGIVAVLSWFLLVRRNRGLSGVATSRMKAIEAELGLQFECHLWTAAGPRGQTTIPFPNGGVEVKKVPKPTGFESVIFLTVGIIAVLIAIVFYVLLT